MKTRPITAAEIEAGKTPKGGFTAKQLKGWGVSWPATSAWRKRILKFGVPASCPYPAGFDAALQPAPVKPATLDLAALAAVAGLPPCVHAALNDAIEIFTDGSCDPNPGPGGWAFAAYRGAEEIHTACGGAAPTTNNRMELQAIIQALKWLDPTQPAFVWSDSQYAVNGCVSWRHGWRRNSWRRGKKNPLANADLWQELDGLLDARFAEVRWTRGHVGTIGNERADQLADEGRRMILETAA